MLMGEIIGTVTTTSFKFKAYNEVRKFDFIAVKKKDLWILAQILEIYRHEDETEALAYVIGYRENGLLKKPREALKPGSMVYLADQEIIDSVLGLRKTGLYIGKLESNADLKVFLNPKDLFRHLAIIAQTGSGKSYLTSVIIEELLEKNYPVVIIDPHGEYSNLGLENKIEEKNAKKFEIAPKAYRIKEFSPNTELNPEAEKLALKISSFDLMDLSEILPSISSSQIGIIYNAMKNLKGDYGIDELIKECGKSDSKAKWSLINQLEMMKNQKIFSDDAIDIEDIVVPGVATIINLRGIEPKNQEIFVHKIAKDLFEIRKMDKIPGLFLVIEESHNYIPERNIGKAVCSKVIRTIASEGRKFSLGLIIVSQRPARIDNNVLSQCNTQIIMRITNPNDLNAISKSFEGVSNEVKMAITSLPSGTALILGKDHPILVEIRTRRSLSKEKYKTGIFARVFEVVRKAEGTLIYYPMWLISANSERILMDAVNGEIKQKWSEAEISGIEKDILDIIKTGLRTEKEIIEKMIEKGHGMSEISESMEKLIKEGKISVGKDGEVKIEMPHLLLKIKSIKMQNAKFIEPRLNQEHIYKKFKTGNFTAEIVYYPYYVRGEEVFDAIAGNLL